MSSLEFDPGRPLNKAEVKRTRNTCGGFQLLSTPKLFTFLTAYLEHRGKWRARTLSGSLEIGAFFANFFTEISDFREKALLQNVTDRMILSRFRPELFFIRTKYTL
jgi:hypothetical protein